MNKDLIQKTVTVKTKKTKIKLAVISGIAVSLILAFGINHFNKNYLYNGKIAQNVFIEEIDVSKMTVEEASKSIKSKYIPQNISVSYEGKSYEIAPKDIDLNYNVDEVVAIAYDYTKTDSYINNIKRYFNLRDDSKEFKIESLYDETKLDEVMKNISKDVNKDMVNAKVYISNSGRISVTPSVTGKELDIISNKEAIKQMINSKEYKNIALKVDKEHPEINTTQAQSVDTLLAQYSTKFSTANVGRSYNIALSAKRGSDILLMPGETYSYNSLTGMRTKSNGFKDAPVIINGVLEDGAGGGVCQTSSTIYNAVLYSGLRVNAVSNHSIRSSYISVGQDAMVNDGGTDLKFTNPYNHPVYIKNIVGNGKITSRIYGNSADKKNISIRVDKLSELSTKTYRQYKDASGNIIKTEYVAKSVYKK